MQFSKELVVRAWCDRLTFLTWGFHLQYRLASEKGSQPSFSSVAWPLFHLLESYHWWETVHTEIILWMLTHTLTHPPKTLDSFFPVCVCACACGCVCMRERERKRSDFSFHGNGLNKDFNRQEYECNFFAIPSFRTIETKSEIIPIFYIPRSIL